MDIFFASVELKELYTSETGAEGFPPNVVDNFFYQLSVVEAAEGEPDLLMLHSLPLESNGERYLIRLGDGWNLSLLIKTTASSQAVEVNLVRVLERSVL